MRLWALGPILVAVWAATALWVVRIVTVRNVPVIFSALGAPMLLGAAYVIVRYGLADVESVLVFFLVLNNVRHRWQITAMLWTWVGLGTLTALYGIA